mgnify:CR=1 FL=1
MALTQEQILRIRCYIERVFFQMKKCFKQIAPLSLGISCIKRYGAASSADKIKCHYKHCACHVLALPTTWVSKKLNFPVKVIQKGPQGESTVEYQNIKTGNVPDSLFELPPGLQKMQMPMMPQTQ